ncbi:MAG: T9SS type A sorting domain-containing protein [Ignavibacteria bacterium]|jgi:hypothetical protein|nr:T9SS type A sorting domain-containing protein [Ignavibacteria bacterium]
MKKRILFCVVLTICFGNALRAQTNSIALPLCISINGDSINVSANDLTTAANKWNSICNMCSSNGCGTLIKAILSDNPNLFKNPYEDISSMVITDSSGLRGYYIYFNNTTQFREGAPHNPNVKNGIANRVIMNSEQITATQYLTDTYDIAIYNLVDVATHQIGELLGLEDANMAHPINSPASKDSFAELEAAFKILYCTNGNELGEKNVAPNPSDKHIDIELNVDTDSYVSVSVMDALGRHLLTPIQRKFYNSGNYTEHISVEALQNGSYFVVIDYGYRRSVLPFIVRK